MIPPDNTPAGADILVVDDEQDVRSILREVLERAGFAVAEAADGESALTAIHARRPSLVILDLGLPRLRGTEVLRVLRAEGNLPVIILSGQGEELDRILGLELGADDFVAKPFSPREVVARVTSVLRRTQLVPTTGATDNRLEFGDLVIDSAAREVRDRGEVIELTAREFDLLVFLASSPRRVFSPEQLLHHVWGAEPGWVNPNTVSEHVYRVRRKLGLGREHHPSITTVRGAGYRFDP